MNATADGLNQAAYLPDRMNVAPELARQRQMYKVLPCLYRCLREIRWHCSPRTFWFERANQHRWMFIIGVNRSGKTTLSNLLKQHPMVSVIPNASNMSMALPNSITEGCPHVWMERVERFRLTEDDKDRVDSSRLLFDWVTFHPRPRPVIVVESDLPAIQMRWFQAILQDSYFVGMVRNGYAVAEGLRLKEGHSIARCARQWDLANQAMLEDIPYVRRLRLVRYEDFVRTPERVVRQLCQFVEIDPEPLLPALKDGWRLGNMDARSSRIRNANAELIRRLAPDEIEKIASSAHSMLKHFDYSPSLEMA